MKKILFLLGFMALLGFDTLGQISYKLLAGQVEPVEISYAFFVRLLHAPWVLGVGIALAGAFFTYMALLRVAPVGPMFAASHFEIVTVSVISVWFLGEHLSPQQIIGCCVILAGVVLLGLDGVYE